ncbi:MAG TPA: hypothetical protein PKY59_01985, partial [Pyrinomonadaceae bacterium]|nr:hypothetical protein [Pyrinomonadaceae bacterium]
MRNFGKKITVNSLFALAFFCLFTFTANAANITWDGGGADNNWSTAANWSGDVVPTNADRVFFNATSTKNATIDVPVTVDWLIEAAGYTGTITQADGQTMNLTQFEIDAGTFQGGAADANFDQVYIYGGTFNAPSGTLTARIFNNQDPTAPIGIFNANGGTVKISSPTNFATLSGYYPLTFNNLILAAQTSEGGTAIDASVAGTLTFNANGGLSDGFIKANGNVVFNSGYVGGIGEIRFVDTVTRTVNLDLSDVKQQILINNPNITVTTNGTASDTINWTQKVTIQSGTLQQSAANYTFSASGTGFLISGGTFQGSVGALNLNTSSTLSSGNLSGGAGTVGYSSGTPTFAQTGGTFSANGNAAFFFLNHT